ncbi:hypothetical protein [Paenibacillus cineris]|uniref:hypothetical protein n=1 Tax=Paenibacillus cineris TaxID=237530 RepID=UPI001BB36D9E
MQQPIKLSGRGVRHTNILPISVKRERSNEGKPAGIVSNELHDRIQEGDSLLFSAPAGDFTLDKQKKSAAQVPGSCL